MVVSVVSVVSVVGKKFIGQIEFILSRTTSCICRFYCIEHFVREVSIKLYLSYEFFSYDGHDRYDRYNDMETRLKVLLALYIHFISVMIVYNHRYKSPQSLREAVRVFRKPKISNEKSNFFLFYQNIPFCELVSNKIF